MRPNWRLSHNTTKWVTPKGLKEAGIDGSEVFNVGDIRSSIRINLGDKYLLANGEIFSKTSYSTFYNINSSIVGYDKSLRTISKGYTNPISKSVGLYNVSTSIIDGMSHNILSIAALDSGDLITSETDLNTVTSPYMTASNMMHYANGRYFFTARGYINNGGTVFIILSSTDLTNWSKSVFTTASTSDNYTDVVYYRNAYYCLRVYAQYSTETHIIELYKSTDGVSFSPIGTSGQISYSNSTGVGYALFVTDSYLGMIRIDTSSSRKYFSTACYYLMNGDTPTSNRGTVYNMSNVYITGPSVNNNFPTTHIGWDDNYIYMFGINSSNVSDQQKMLWTVPKSSIQGGSFSPTLTYLNSISVAKWSARADIGMVMFGDSSVYRLSGSSPILIGNFDMTDVGTSYFAGNTENAIFSNGQSSGKSWGTFKNVLPLVSIDGCYSYIKVK